jgi:isopentenyl diphosphate isomerase/L-lactate dehydrogenase-like FMN-dependent dehydrogenase
LKDSQEALEKMQTDGAKVIAVTCDMQSPYYPRDVEDDNLGGKPRATKAKQDVPPPLRNARGNWWYTWKYLDQLREIIKVPMIAKGIVTPEDAELCIQHGLDGIYVSNHGGRSLCYEPSTIEVLPEIMTAVRGRVPVIFDSGVYHGADAFKALALGAKMVGLGRAPRWGLGAYGAPGVTRLLEIMQKDLAATMAKYGRPTVASIDQTAVRPHFV